MRSEDKPEVNLENVQNASDMTSLCSRGLDEGAHMSCWGSLTSLCAAEGSETV